MGMTALSIVWLTIIFRGICMIIGMIDGVSI
jgi:hypothetical protein